jgi:hypothetical protein
MYKQQRFNLHYKDFNRDRKLFILFSGFIKPRALTGTKYVFLNRALKDGFAEILSELPTQKPIEC